jgi:hypothetical protein
LNKARLLSPSEPNGTPHNEGTSATAPRTIAVHFNADFASFAAASSVFAEPHLHSVPSEATPGPDLVEGVDLHFRPNAERLQVYPGDSALSFYSIHNKTNQPISGISVYNIIPQKAGIYFNKIQCFCFEEQRLKPNESIEMPILFYIDSDFEKDPKMEDVNSIILSYTFFIDPCASASGAQA